MGHLLRSYAWLLGDVALLLWVIYELVSLRSKPAGKSKPPDDSS
jgi:hypothetical protein